MSRVAQARAGTIYLWLPSFGSYQSTPNTVHSESFDVFIDEVCTPAVNALSCEAVDVSLPSIHRLYDGEGDKCSGAPWQGLVKMEAP